MAESVEIPNQKSIIYKLRRGVHFRDVPPVNGRELDAHDVVASWNATLNPNHINNGKKDWKWTAVDQWTVKTEWPKPIMDYGTIYNHIGGEWGVVAREFLEQGLNRADWKNAMGSGPFFPIEFLEGSFATYVKNPNYWQQDPLHPNNKLPYLDGIKFIELEEAAKVAALRTGKIDVQVSGMAPQYKKELVEQMPKGTTVNNMPRRAMLLAANIVKPPFNDKRVRHAVMLAINQEEMKNELNQGDAVYPTFPLAPAWAPYHISLEDLERDLPHIRRMFDYHPDEAKKLLAEAGYPNGFDTNIITSQLFLEDAEAASLYLAQVGINVEVRDVGEAQMYSLTMSRTPDPSYTGLVTSDTGCQMAFSDCIYKFHLDPRSDFAWFAQGNKEFEESDYGQELITRIEAMYDAKTPEEHLKKWREVSYWAYEEMWFMPLVMKMGQNYTLPWMHGANGAHGLYNKWLHNQKYVWLDSDMREEMTGRKANEF